MSHRGFIHDKTDVKFLILYILSRVAAPIDFFQLTDLTMVDEGVDYFVFAQAVSEMEAAGLLEQQDQRYTITDKGRSNGAVCESSLPYSVRAKCGERLSRLNAELRRSAQIRAESLPREDGAFTLRLSLDDDSGNLLTLELLTPTAEQATQLAAAFRARPEQIYNGILDLLLREADKGEGS